MILLSNIELVKALVLKKNKASCWLSYKRGQHWPLLYSISLDDFYEWNPAAGDMCAGLWTDYYIYVGVK